MIKGFWQKHPALLYGIAAALGCGIGLGSALFVAIPALALFSPIFFGSPSLKKRLCLAALVMGSFALYCSAHYTFPTLTEEGVSGWGRLEISSINKTEQFGPKWRYRGTLKQFKTTAGKIIALNIPCALLLPANKERPQADHTFDIHGVLKATPYGTYRLIPTKGQEWIAVKRTWRLAELRNHAKQKVKAFIQAHIADTRSASFLTGIATGDFEDKVMAFEFGRFGLQHIMAISGFHFAIVAAALSSILRLFVSKRKACCALIFLMSSYFVFLGCGPSIMRAWVMVLVFLTGMLMEKEVVSLNSLGIAILVILIVDPLLFRSIGFQFSTLATAAILIYYEAFENALQALFQKRPLTQVIQMDRTNQHGYCILALFRQSIALTLAVSSVALPLMLFFFHKFPLMSLLYNLFFPFLVSISMLLLIVGSLAIATIPPLGEALFHLNSIYTSLMLDLTYNMPTTLDFVIRVKEVPPLMIITYFTLLGIAAIPLHHWRQQQITTHQDFAFL